MNVILSGGVGKIRDEIMISYYASIVPAGSKMLYLPIAKRTRPFSESYEKMCANMIKLGVKAEIEMWPDLNDKSFKDLIVFDSIYIEGGNPFILLNELKKTGFIKILHKYIKSGKLVYGQSAGALIMGKDISFAEFFGENAKNIVRLSDTNGLDLFNGYSIWPHYIFDNEIIIKKLIFEKRLKFLALPEYTGIHFSPKGNKVCGVSSMTIFNKNLKKTYNLGENVNI